MTTLLALRIVELGSVFSLVLLWAALGGLLLAILRRARSSGTQPPRGL